MRLTNAAVGGSHHRQKHKEQKCLSVPMMLEVDPKVASQIQARARECGVSVDVYLRELIDQKETESETSNGLSSEERVRLLREWASDHSTNLPFLSDDAISRESIYETEDRDKGMAR